MTADRAGTAVELPRSAAKHPPTVWLRMARPLARFITERRVDVKLHGAENVPAHGPVIMASNHVGVADGPLLATYTPRPVHALTKIEMFKGKTGRLLQATGQIPLFRFGADPSAMKTCLRVLRDGGVVGIFPEGTRGAGEFERFHLGVGYLALVSGAPVVPVIQFGTRAPGAGNHELPEKGETVEIVFGTPYTFDSQPWPRTKEQVGKATEVLREHLLRSLADAKALTGRELPGPIPGGDPDDPDPPTGITDPEAP